MGNNCSSCAGPEGGSKPSGGQSSSGVCDSQGACSCCLPVKHWCQKMFCKPKPTLPSKPKPVERPKPSPQDDVTDTSKSKKLDLFEGTTDS